MLAPGLRHLVLVGLLGDRPGRLPDEFVRLVLALPGANNEGGNNNVYKKSCLKGGARGAT